MLARLSVLLLTVVAISLGCSEGTSPETRPPAEAGNTEASTSPLAKSVNEGAGAPVNLDVEKRQNQEIKDRNAAVLAKLREEEEIARKAGAMSAEVNLKTDVETAPIVPSESLPPSDTVPEKVSRSSMDELRDRVTEFEPRIGEISKKADTLDDNYRRYVDACYQKSTTAESSGSYSGHASGYSYGAAAGRDWFAVYGARTDMAYGGTYNGSTSISNETTPYCRELWSDIVNGSREVNTAMKELQQDARRKGVLPGHMRDLRKKYRLDWEGWTR